MWSTGDIHIYIRFQGGIHALKNFDFLYKIKKIPDYFISMQPSDIDFNICIGLYLVIYKSNCARYIKPLL